MDSVMRNDKIFRIIQGACVESTLVTALQLSKKC